MVPAWEYGKNIVPQTSNIQHAAVLPVCKAGVFFHVFPLFPPRIDPRTQKSSGHAHPKFKLQWVVLIENLDRKHPETFFLVKRVVLAKVRQFPQIILMIGLLLGGHPIHLMIILLSTSLFPSLYLNTKIHFYKLSTYHSQ